ncbi:MAG: hypothetical protein DRO88_08365 [Promethearchaeia archaeon]|nr:MAG: hypothetical protein DRO88_08365 [Candidatus Lokiarchaeia archaeon]
MSQFNLLRMKPSKGIKTFIIFLFFFWVSGATGLIFTGSWMKSSISLRNSKFSWISTSDSINISDSVDKIFNFQTDFDSILKDKHFVAALNIIKNSNEERENISNSSTQRLFHINQDFGFEVILPGNRTNYRTAPQLQVNIINESIISISSYNISMYCISAIGPESAEYLDEGVHEDNQTKIETNIESETFIVIDHFRPQDSTSIEFVNLQIKQFWNEFMGDGSLLQIEINSNQSNLLYDLTLVKDITPPMGILGFFWEENHNQTQTQSLIPLNLTDNIFNNPPTLSLNITDTVASNISIACIINNHYWTTSVQLFPLGILGENSTEHLPENSMENIMENITFRYGQAIVNLSLDGFFENWENIDDGNLTGILSLRDSAGNVGDWILFTFIKDTVEPILDSGIPDRSWLSIGDYSLKDLENPLFNTVELKDKPEFRVHLKDNDIKSVWLQIFWNDLSSSKPEAISSQSQSDSFSNSQSQSPENSQVSNIINIFGKKNGTFWQINFPESLWAQFNGERVHMSLEVQDFAGNIASYSFSIIKLTDEYKNPFLYFYVIIGVGIISLLFISAFVAASFHEIKHQRSNLENDINNIDSALLDLVLQPLDHFMLSNVTDIIDQEGHDCDLSALLNPKEQEFMRKPIQILDITELRLLLNRYPMKSLDLEEFVREMLALSPKERRSFLLEYMEEYNHSTSNLNSSDGYFDVWLSEMENSKKIENFGNFEENDINDLFQVKIEKSSKNHNEFDLEVKPKINSDFNFKVKSEVNLEEDFEISSETKNEKIKDKSKSKDKGSRHV